MCTTVTLLASGLPPPRGVREKETWPPHPVQASGSPEGGAGPTTCSAHCPAHSWPPAPLSAGRRVGPPRLPSGPRVTELMSVPVLGAGLGAAQVPARPPGPALTALHRPLLTVSPGSRQGSPQALLPGTAWRQRSGAPNGRIPGRSPKVSGNNCLPDD